MTRILAIAMGAGVGWLLGFAVSLVTAFNYAPIIGAVIFAAAALSESGSSGFIYDRYDRKILNRAFDMSLVTAWGAYPALKRIKDIPHRYDHAVEEILTASFPDLVRARMVNFNEVIDLIRESSETGTEPTKALRRHNRAFKPSIFKKTSATYTVLDTVAKLLVYAGGDRDAAIWYFHFAKKLGVPYKNSAFFLESAINEQEQSSTLIPGYPKATSPLATISEGLTVSTELVPYIDSFVKKRSDVLDKMFSSDSRAA